jgi:uncharacterized protein YukE
VGIGVLVGLSGDGDGGGQDFEGEEMNQMAEEFMVKADELRAVATRLGELGSQAEEAMSSAQAQIAGKGPVWGTGALGSQFADGSDGFVSQLAAVAASVHATAKLLTHDAQQLKDAADGFQRSDDQV